MRLILSLLFLLLLGGHAPAQFHGGPFSDPEPGNVEIKKHYFGCQELDATPSAPGSADSLRFYCKDDGSGTTKLYTIDSNGVEVALGSGSGAGTVGIGTFTPNRVVFQIDTTTTGTPYNILADSNGNFGIGTTVPRALLNVNSSAAQDLFRVDDTAGSDATPFIIDQTGNVGIGTAVPQAVLAISSTLNQALFRVDDNGNGDLSPFIIDASGNVGIGTTNTERDALLVMGGNVGIGTWVPSTKLDVAGTIVTVGLNVTGNVGIGSIAPGSILDIAGDTRITSTNRLTFGNDALGTTNISTNAATGGNLFFRVGSSNRMIIGTDGNVGISSTVPGQTLDVNGTARIRSTNTLGFGNDNSASLRASANTTPDIIFQGNSSDVMRLTSAGNLGINTTSVPQKLYVAGTAEFQALKLNQNPLAGGVMVGSSLGLGTWMAASTLPISVSPGGANPQLQFNNANAFGGVANSGADSNGNIGISTSTPQTKLAIQGSVGIGTWVTNTGVSLAVFGGNVGLGTVNPNSTQQIVGNFAVNSFLIVSATGGSTVTSGGNEIHTFNSSSSLVVTVGGTVTYQIIGGGGGGGGNSGGGGGAGQVRSGTAVLTAGTYAITVGAKGTGGVGAADGNPGTDSTFNGVTATHGNGGLHDANTGGTSGSGNAGGSGISSPQFDGGGGGGDSGAGVNASASSAGNGGPGTASSISGSSVTSGCGGGGGGSTAGGGTTGGTGGCASAGNGTAVTSAAGGSATANSGSGGGGGGGGAGNGGDGATGQVTISFSTTGAEGGQAFTVTTAGLVGVNQSSPVNQFDVSGATAIGSYAGVSTAPANGLIVSGNVGIGTTTPQGKFVVTNGNVGIGTWAPAGILTVTSGNVGIGTAIAPRQLLNVGGSIYLDRSTGKLYTKDTGGTACTSMTTSGGVATFGVDTCP